jgi:hypothetical protein
MEGKYIFLFVKNCPKVGKPRNMQPIRSGLWTYSLYLHITERNGAVVS